MRITNKTKYTDFEPVEKYIDEETTASLKKAAERAYKSMYELTFAQFLQACSGYFDGVIGKAQNPTVLQVYWRKRFAEFQVEFNNTLKATNVPLTPKQQRASEGLPKQTFAESMLVFIRQYFGLHSFKEAEQITMGEIIIARKDAYRSAMFERKMAAIEMNEIKTRKR